MYKRNWNSKRCAILLLVLCLFLSVVSGMKDVPKAAAAVLSENKISNAGFEMVFEGKPAGWIHSPGQYGVEFGISDQESHSGGYSVFIDHPTGNNLPNWKFAQGVSVSDTEEYEFSAWIKVDDVEMTGKPMLDVDFHDSNNDWIAAADIKMEQEAFTGDWQHFVFRFQPVEGTVRLMPYLMVTGGSGKVYFDDVSFVQLSDGSNPTEGTYHVWTAPSVMNIRRDAAPLASSNSFHLDMAKREYQSGQVLLTADGGNVDITEAVISDLTSGSSTIPASEVEVFVQHYIKTTSKSNVAYEPGWYPDALIPIDPYMFVHGSLEVASGNNQAIWFTVKTKADTPAGLYSGEISITANGDITQVPVTVRVRDFALTEENHAQTAFAIWGKMLPYGYPGLVEGSAEYWQIMRNYYEFLLDYHVTPTNLPIPTDDYEQYIVDAEPYINDPRVSAYNLPYTVGDFESGRAEQLVDGLKAKGLFDKAYYYLGASEIDEPTPDMFPLVKQRSQQIAAIDPNLRHLVTTGFNPQLMGEVNTFVPLFRDFESEEYLQQVQQFQANGGNMWWYGCVIPINPYPTYHIDDDLISARLVSWMQHAYNIEGNLYWAVNIYGKSDGISYTARDIWNDPSAFPGANGDGFLLYPGYKYGMNSPIATLRLQTIRDGNQDYEYLLLLEERINQAAQQLGVTVSPAEIIQPYHDRLFANVKSFTKNGQDLQQVRSEIADYIEELEKNPQALIVIKDQPNEMSKKEIIVYTAKGTEVSINQVDITGEAIPNNTVADRYSYMMDFNLGLNEVPITLKQGTEELAITKRVFVKSRTLQPIMLKKVIHNFPNQQSISNIETMHGVTILGITEDHATGDGNALKVKIPASIPNSNPSYPGINIPVRAELKDDFNWAETVELDIYNASSEPRDMFIKFYDENGVSSDHRYKDITAGENHLSFNLTEVKNYIRDIAFIIIYTYPGDQEAELYFSDFHLLGIDTEAMKQHELPFTPVIPYLDGKLNETMWNSRTPLTYKTGVTSNEAAISFNYNDEYLFVAAAVTDDHVINSGAVNPWDDDSVEIYVDGTGKQGAYDDHTIRYVFRVNDPEVHTYRVTPRVDENIKYSYAATADGYNMEIAIPWRSININPLVDNIIGLTVHVNDKDVNDAGLEATGKLSLTEDISQDAVSSATWMAKKFVKDKMMYQLQAVESNSMNIDGKIDEMAWNTNWNIGFTAFGSLNDQTNGGRLGLLWSPDYLYAAFDVKDSNIHVPQERPVWEETSVELFVDSEFVQGVRDHRTHQYTIRVDDPEIYYNGSPNANLTQGIIQKSTRTTDGYQVEMAIPWTTIGVTAELGKKLGITAHLNLVEPTGGVALTVTDNGISDGTSTVNYVPFELTEQSAVNHYTVSFDVEGGSTVPNQHVSYGSKAIKPADPTKAGYTFQGWFVDRTYATAFDFDVEISSHTTVYAKWTLSSMPAYSGYVGSNQETTSTTSEYVVKAQDIAPNQPKIIFAEGQQMAVITSQLLQQLQQQNRTLTIEQGDAQLTLSPEWIEELLESSKAADFENLIIELVAVEEERSKGLVSLAASQQKADISLPGQMWEVLVGWRNGDKVEAMTTFKTPLLFSLPLAKQKPTNHYIYRLGSDGSLVYLNEQIAGERISVPLFQGGQIAELLLVKQFDDLSKVQWAGEAIRELAARQIIKGTSTTTFSPLLEITRAEFAVMLARVLELEKSKDIGDSGFADVNSDAWFATAVNAAAQAGLVKGEGDNRFNPQASITREEMAVMLKRAFDWQRKQAPQTTETHSYADDAHISSWAKEATKTLAELGIMVGRSGNKFVPKASVNRAEAAQALYNYLKKIN